MKPSINIVREFISDISAALKANPKKNLKDMPKKEVFKELFIKLAMEVKNSSRSTGIESNNVIVEGEKGGSRKQFDKQFKIDTVKRIKEQQLSVPKVAEEIGISCSSAIYRWILEYEKKGENAFKGRGREAVNKRKLIDKLFDDAFPEAAVSNTLSGADANKNGVVISKLDKGKMTKYRLYKQGEYRKEFKTKTVQLIKEYKLPLLQVSEKLDIAPATLNRWIRGYDERGDDAFPGRNSNPYRTRNTTSDSSCKKVKNATSSRKRRKFDKKLKITAVQLVLDHKQKGIDVARKLGISDSYLSKWILEYKKGGESAFQGEGVYYE